MAQAQYAIECIPALQADTAGLSKQAQAKAMAAETLYRDGELSVQEICDQLGISKPTLYTYLKHRSVRVGARGGG